MEATQKSKRVELVLTGLLILVGALLVTFASVYYQVWRQAQIDEAQPADVIVVLGAAQYQGRPSPVLKARLDHALELYHKQLAPRIITTGGHGRGSPFTESEVSREYLSQHGVSSEFITVETRGQSTLESAAAVVEIMDCMQLGSCIVVSDGYHIHRIKRMLEVHGIRAFGSPRARGSDSTLKRSWYYARESLIYILWRVGIGV